MLAGYKKTQQLTVNLKSSALATISLLICLLKLNISQSITFFFFLILFCLKRCGLCVGNVEMVRWGWIELLSKFSFSAFRLILTGGLDKGISCLNLPLVMLPLHHDEQKDDYEWWWAHSVNAMLHLIFIILRPGNCMPKNVSKFATKQRKSILWE